MEGTTGRSEHERIEALEELVQQLITAINDLRQEAVKDDIDAKAVKRINAVDRKTNWEVTVENGCVKYKAKNDGSEAIFIDDVPEPGINDIENWKFKKDEYFLSCGKMVHFFGGKEQ